MKSTEIRRQKKSYQTKNVFKPRIYNEHKRQSLKTDDIRNRAMWNERLIQARNKNPKIKDMFDSKWSFIQIAKYIIKMIRLIKKDL